MTKREFIASLSDADKQSRIASLLSQLNDAQAKPRNERDTEREKRIRGALRDHGYYIREHSARRYDYVNNIIA